CAGRSTALAPARPFRDYLAWLARQDTVAAEAHWRKLLGDVSARTQLNVLRAPEGPEAVAADVQSLLPAATTERLQALARQHHVTLNTVMQAAWGILLRRYSGEPDVVFGTTVSGRPTAIDGIE